MDREKDSPSKRDRRDSDDSRRGSFDPSHFAGQNPFGLSAGAGADNASMYAQLAAAQMQAYSAMMGHHPAFSAMPFGGLGLYGEGMASPLHSAMGAGLGFLPGGAEWWHAASEHARQVASNSGYDYFASSLNSLANSFGNPNGADAMRFEALLRDPEAAQKSFGMYPYMASPFSSVASTATTTVTSSSHSAPAKKSSPAATIASPSHHHHHHHHHSKSSPASTITKSCSSSSKASKNRDSHKPSTSTEPSRKTHLPAVPTSVIKVPSSKSFAATSLFDSHKGKSEKKADSEEDEFMAKEVLNHLKNQQDEFIKKEKDKVKLQTGDSSQDERELQAQRELAAELLRQRQHEQLVEHLKKPQYDAMPNLKKFAEEQIIKHMNKEKEGEKSPSKPELSKNVLEHLETPPQQEKKLATHEFLSKEQQEMLNKKRLVDQIRKRVQKKASSTSNSSQKLKSRSKVNRTTLKIPSLCTDETKIQKRKQEDLKARLEAQLKQQQIQLRMAKKAQQSKEVKEKTKIKKSTSLLGNSAVSETSDVHTMQVETDPNKPLVAKFRTLSRTTDSDSSSSSSGSDSSSNSDSSDSDSPSESQSQSSKKRPAEDDDVESSDGSIQLKKKKEIDEKEMRIPLEHGWRRETRIRTVGQRGIVGDVIYYAPCEKPLRSLVEINKYLVANDITDLVKDNFSFSTKINVGDFLEMASDGNGFVSLSEQDFQVLLSAANERRPAKRRAVKRTQRLKKEAAKLEAQEKLAKKIEQQELAKQSMEMKLKRKIQRQQRIKDQQKMKQLKEMEKEREKDSLKMLRHQEKEQRLEAMRIEREVRAHQLIEARKHKKEEIQNQRYKEAMKKAKERELKRQQAVMLKEQERERRRQHMILLKTLEARKRLEEKERLREEKNRERVLQREKRLEQRRIEIQMSQELRQPVDDMRLKDVKSLPKLDRIPGVKLAGQPFGDVLMVNEFLNNFGSALELDEDSIPSLNTLQMALLNEEEYADELTSLVTHLLKIACSDPGVPNPKEAVTKLNQKISDVDITDDNVSEVLRIFMEARNGKSDELSKQLETKPYQALNVTHKAAILAFLCNELLNNEDVMGEIEESIEKISNLRKDKWTVEGKLRKLRSIQSKKVFRPMVPKPNVVNDDSNSVSQVANETKRGSDDEEEESGNESGAEQGDGNISDGEEDQSLSGEDIEKKIEKLSKQQGQFRSKVFDACHKLRAIEFGVDRYKRRYWVLPYCGGMFVEGIESGEPDECSILNEDSDKENLNSTKEYEEENDNDTKTKLKITDSKTEVESSNLNSEAVENMAMADSKSTVAESKKDIASSNMNSPKSEEDSGVANKKKIDSATKVCTDSNIKEESFNVNLTKAEPNSDDNLSETSENSINFKPSLQNSIDKIAEKRKENARDKYNISEKCDMNGEIDQHTEITERPELVKMNNSGKLGNEISKDGSHTNVLHVKEDSEKFNIKIENENYRMKAERAFSDAKVEDDSLKGEEKSGNKNEEYVQMEIDSKTLVNGHDDGKSSENENEGDGKTDSKKRNHTIGQAEESKDSFKTDTLNSTHKSIKLGEHASKNASGYLNMDSLLGNSSLSGLDSSQFECSNSSYMNSYFLPGQLNSAEQLMKAYAEKNKDPNWFSILPRIPCDNTSLTDRPEKTPSKIKNEPSCSTSYSPFGFGSSPLLTSFQMGQLQNVGYGFGMFPMTSSPFGFQDKLAHRNSMAPSESSMDGMLPPFPVDNVYDEPQQIPSELQRGWWRITDPNQFKSLLKCLSSRGFREKHLQRNFQKSMDFAAQKCGKGSQEVFELDITAKDREISLNSSGAPSPDKKESWNAEIAYEIEKDVLDDIEALGERIVNASLQIKGWKMPEKASDDDSITLIPANQKKANECEHYPMQLAKDRLSLVEQNVERRYLKPPMNKMPEINLSNLKNNAAAEQDTSEDELPKGLIAWRQALSMATSPAQLALCAVQLNNCIAWEKSVMKVLCQICRLDDNEAELLLCDTCDKGYHTYCFKPKMTDIPDGNWYCYECLSRASKVPHCIRCGKKNGRMAQCNHCPVAFHIDCIDPPFQRTPRKWVCGSCSGVKGKYTYTYQRARHMKWKENRKKKISQSYNEDDSEDTEQTSSSRSESPIPEKRNKKSDTPCKDLSSCKMILMELDKHPDAGPFRTAVNCKKFPTYKKFIRHPMDFGTMKTKLKNNQYKTPAEFAADARLVFDNCQTFNEDDSEVGETGHTLRQIFEDRYKELYG